MIQINPKRRFSRGITVIGLTSLALVLFVVGAMRATAHNEPNNNIANSNRPVNERLEDARLRVCQRHETVINRIMDRMAARTQRILDVFSRITERVQAYYERRGISVENYQALVDDVEAKKTAAETQVTHLQNHESFECEANNPRGIAQAFKEDLRATADALKEYKTAVKNLIVGVKSAQGQISSNRNTNAESNTNQE